MKTRKLTSMFTPLTIILLAIAAAMPLQVAAQNTIQIESSDPTLNKQTPNLVGVWEETEPAFVDCQTREPAGPMIKVLLTFNEGGTNYIEDTLPFEGPYRSTGGGIWKRTSGRSYTYVNMHYSFEADKTFTGTVKVRSNLTIAADGDSFSETGTFDVSDPAGNVVFTGCFEGTAHRLTF